MSNNFVDKNTLHEKIKLIDFARKYSIETLGFNVGHAFEKEDYSIDSYYWIMFSPKTKLRLDYKMFSNKLQAKQAEAKLSSEYDTDVRGSKGHSGDCVIIKSLVLSDSERIAYVVVHEKWHNFVNDISSPENRLIDEAAARAIGFNESMNIMKKSYGMNSEYWSATEEREESRAESIALNALARSLYELYESDKLESEILKEKQKALRYFNMTYGKKLGYNIKNNADFCDQYMYTALYPLTDRIYQKYGKEAIPLFVTSMRIAKEQGFNAGVNELLKYYDGLDTGIYKKAFNIFKK